MVAIAAFILALVVCGMYKCMKTVFDALENAEIVEVDDFGFD